MSAMADLRPAAVAETGLVVAAIPEADLLNEAVEGWRELHDSVSPRLPFTAPLWNALWWKHYPSDRMSVKDESFTLSIRDSAGKLRGVAPMMTTIRPAVGGLGIRVLNCFGTDPNVTEIRGVICRPEDETEVIRALRAYVRSQPSRWDWIDWGTVRLAHWDPVTHGVGKGNALSERDITDYFLTLPETWEEFRAGLSRNMKEALRKCYNSLKRDGFTPELRVVSDPADCPQALSAFFTLHASRGQADNMVHHPDVFRGATDRAFLTEFATTMARRDQLRVFQLLVGGRVVATRIGFLYGEELYLYYSGFEPDMGKYSVMTTTVVEALKWAIEQRLRVVNLSSGTDVSKLRWGPTGVEFRTLMEISPGWRATAAFRAYRKSRSISGHPLLGRVLTLLGKR